MNSDQGELLRKQQKLALLKAKKKLEYELPHLYEQKFYYWARVWWNSTNTINLMNKGNQVGGSSIQIRKAIEWACCDPKTRMELFGKKPDEPLVFLYFMPSLNLFAREFHTKWIPQFMPRGDARTTGRYSWRAEYDEKKLEWINFIDFPESNSIIFTLSYGSDPHKSMQAMTPDAIFADEEMPEHIWGEIIARLSSKFAKGLGYFHMTCTPTRGEKLWDDAFNNNKFPTALVMNVSQYDCLEFEDGSPGVHTVEGINQFKQSLPDERNIQIRVYGKYAKVEGLVFESFDGARNNLPRIDLGPNSYFYSGLDYGSGGPSGHPAAIVIVEVSEDRRLAQVHKAWVGNKTEKTDPSYIVNKYLQMRGDLRMTGEYYDWASSDLGGVALSMGIAIQKADKSRELGVGLLNSLFKNQMLNIPKEEEFVSLVRELDSLRVDKVKRHAADDQCDALRYAISSVYFDFTHVKYNPNHKPKAVEEKKNKFSRNEFEPSYILRDEIEDEINEFNELLD